MALYVAVPAFKRVYSVEAWPLVRLASAKETCRAPSP